MHCGCLYRFSVGRLILKRGLLLIRRFLHVRGFLRERGLLRLLGIWGMLGFRGAFLPRNSTTGGGKGITLTKTARRTSRHLLSCRNLLRKRGLRRKRTSRCLQGNRGNLLR